MGDNLGALHRPLLKRQIPEDIFILGIFAVLAMQIHGVTRHTEISIKVISKIVLHFAGLFIILLLSMPQVVPM